jgi:plastocyanin
MTKLATIIVSALLLHSGAAKQAQTTPPGTVTATFVLAQKPGATHKHAASGTLADVVLWLTPMEGTLPPPAPKNNLRLVQKNKEFTPHLLVVPAGSSVEFPNLDPFFHNVFSLFDGKRFDLGLYEAGSTRSVRFEREGVSYIFCNIHPEMAAVIVALRSPYYGISAADGSVSLHDVPSGRYRVHVWGEQLKLAPGNDAQQIIEVGPSASLGQLPLVVAPNALANHKNKFGEDYAPAPNSKY